MLFELLFNRSHLFWNLKASPMPPAPLLWPVVLLMFVFQISLLNFVLVRWSPDVVSMSGLWQHSPQDRANKTSTHQCTVIALRLLKFICEKHVGLWVFGYFFKVPLLKCGLARWFLDVGFQIIFFQITLILETDIGTFGAQNQSFGMPGASTLAPWGTMGRSRGTWEHKKGDLGVQAWIFIDFGLISGFHFESFSGPLDQNRCVFFMLVSKSLF